jgi:hypothetical protein
MCSTVVICGIVRRVQVCTGSGQSDLMGSLYPLVTTRSEVWMMLLISGLASSTRHRIRGGVCYNLLNKIEIRIEIETRMKLKLA